MIDVYSRYIVGWSLSFELDTENCMDALEMALKGLKPEIVNSDQGCQFTSQDWVTAVQSYGIHISMDGKGRWADNIYAERFWRTIKYEAVYLHSFDTVDEARQALEKFIDFYNYERFHQSLNYHTPDAIFIKKTIPTKQELFEAFAAYKSNQNGVAAMI